MLTLRRENLKLKHISGMLPAQGSSDIEITIENDGTYSGYSPVLLLGYGFQFSRKFLMVNKNSTNKYVITSDAFADGNDISLAILLVGSNKVATNQLIYSVNKTPYRTVESKKVDLWRDNLEAYVDAYLESIGAGGLPQPYTLPIATSETLGGVKPVAKTDKMTQPVGVDENGALFTQPTNAGSTITTDPTLSKPGQAADAKAVGDQFSKLKKDKGGLTYGIYVGDTQPTNGVMYWLDTSDEGTNDEPIIPDVPDTPIEPTVTLTSISATYNGGDVPVGTNVNSLSGITVKANFSNGMVQSVTTYTLSGTINEGVNTITVSFEGKTTTFTVNGIAEEVENEELMCESNIVKAGHSISLNSEYSFYQIDTKENVNVYEIQVEQGVTYEASLTNGSQYGVPYWSDKQINAVRGTHEFAISPTQFTDFDTVGSRVTWTFNGETTVDTSTASTKINNGDGTYTNKVTFTPTISGYLYTSNLQTANKYSIKKVVA